MTTETPVAGHQYELVRAIGPKLLLLFIVGDILGTGVYALTGEVAGEVGGAAWAPFLLAFLVATITAFSYLELYGGVSLFVAFSCWRRWRGICSGPPMFPGA